MVAGVNRFRAYGDLIYYFNSNSLRAIDAELNEFGIDNNVKGGEFVGEYNDCVIVKDENGLGYLVTAGDFKLEKIPLPENTYFYDQMFDEFIPVYHSTSIFEPRINGVFNISNNELNMFPADCKASVVIEGFGIYISGSVLCLYDQSTGKQKWSINLIEDGVFPVTNSDLKTQFGNILFRMHDSFWIQAGNLFFLEISVTSGKLIRKIDLMGSFGLLPQTVEYNSFSLGDVHFDEKRGVIKSLSHRYYWEFDINTLQGRIVKDFGVHTLPEYWRIKRSTVYAGDKNLYFIGARKGEAVNRAVGIFDTEKAEVVWYDEPLEEKKFLFFADAPPQANAKLLAVLDTEKNLRVYERDGF
jgi:hypothetical protein